MAEHRRPQRARFRRACIMPGGKPLLFTARGVVSGKGAGKGRLILHCVSF
jgi:hypothetical protein